MGIKSLRLLDILQVPNDLYGERTLLLGTNGTNCDPPLPQGPIKILMSF